MFSRQIAVETDLSCKGGWTLSDLKVISHKTSVTLAPSPIMADWHSGGIRSHGKSWVLCSLTCNKKSSRHDLVERPAPHSLVALDFPRVLGKDLEFCCSNTRFLHHQLLISAGCRIFADHPFAAVHQMSILLARMARRCMRGAVPMAVFLRWAFWLSTNCCCAAFCCSPANGVLAGEHCTAIHGRRRLCDGHEHCISKFFCTGRSCAIFH